MIIVYSYSVIHVSAYSLSGFVVLSVVNEHISFTTAWHPLTMYRRKKINFGKQSLVLYIFTNKTFLRHYMDQFSFRNS